MESKDLLLSITDASVASGLDRSALRKWLKNPVKGKVACSLVRGGALTMDQYAELKDSSISFYNNMLLAFINMKFSIAVNEVAELLGVTRKTVTSLAEGKASTTTKKALFYVCSNKLGILEPEELFYASNNKTN